MGSSFSSFSAVSNVCGISSLSGWAAGSEAQVIVNGAAPGPLCLGYIPLPNDVLLMHPGGDNSYSVTRWTAPEDGIFQISGFFSGQNPGYPTSTDDHILVNGTASVNINIHSFNIPTNFTLGVALSTGDTVDFAVGPGGNGYAGDSTALSATITSGGSVSAPVVSGGSAGAPEPGTMWLFSGVLAAGAAIRRRFTR